MSDEQPDAMARIAELEAEVAMLRQLVGPSEESYVKLRADVLGARDVAMTAEQALGRERGYSQLLESEIARLRRDSEWIRAQIVDRAKRLRHVKLTPKILGRRSD